MKTIQANTTLTARSVCDYNCIFSLFVIARAGDWAKINYNGKIRRAKIKSYDGEEFIMPDRYSMAPVFRAA